MAKPKLVTETEFKIDKGIPLPPPAKGGRNGKYPWREMEVGDSFFMPGAARSGAPQYLAGQRTGFRFSSRGVIENGVKGRRIWRIE